MWALGQQEQRRRRRLSGAAAAKEGLMSRPIGLQASMLTACHGAAAASRHDSKGRAAEQALQAWHTRARCAHSSALATSAVSFTPVTSAIQTGVARAMEALLSGTGASSQAQHVFRRSCSCLRIPPRRCEAPAGSAAPSPPHPWRFQCPASPPPQAALRRRRASAWLQGRQWGVGGGVQGEDGHHYAGREKGQARHVLGSALSNPLVNTCSPPDQVRTTPHPPGGLMAASARSRHLLQRSRRSTLSA